MQEPLASRANLPPLAEGEGRAGSIAESLNLGGPLAGIVAWLGRDGLSEGFLQRGANHLLIIVLTVAVLAIGSFNLPRQQLRARRYVAPAPPTEVAPLEAGGAALDAPLPLAAAPLDTEQDAFIRAAVPHTIIPERPRIEIESYRVQPGDSVISIAAQFGLAPETVMWANGRLEDNPDLLRVGQELLILPVNGVYHQVGGNDTLETIASTYLTSVAAIINFPLNNLDPENPVIQPGQWLVVPGGTKPYVPKRVQIYSGPVPDSASTGSGAFVWPVSGTITQGYWDRHRALDIGGWLGAPVVAADSGYVVASQWDDSGYGRLVVIDHGNGFQTLYAHLQVYYVEVGDSVAKGQQIGEMGSTGNSTGPHLHFEVIKSGAQRNPWGFLP